MLLATDPKDLPLSLQDLIRGTALTLGNFDGVHPGHQALIRKTVSLARQKGSPSIAVTFDPHPVRVLKGDAAPAQLLTLQNKLEYLADLGLDLTLTLPFTPATAAMEAEDFVRVILCESLRARFLVLGYDYAFGRGRRGNAALLADMGKKFGFEIEETPALRLGKKIVSSSLIREALLAGKVREGTFLLGRHFFVQGTVEKGDRRGGRLLGFPTANLRLEKNILLPKKGVYAVLAEINPPAATLGETLRGGLKGVANVGTNPTFGGNALRLETHLLDFDADIYGSLMRVHFIERLREERKFPGADELLRQIRLDVAKAGKITSSSLDAGKGQENLC
ncbi:MAG: bifunctional riboflavin kinase/FAD synthetase [Desulfovibrio sp.]|nr:bifunctional riboflavin kinase/FAD synthetase [Desulfovibrio sp.]